MTREKLIDAVRNALWRMKFAESEDDVTVERYKEIWHYEWDADLDKAIRLLARIEAAGVRMVPETPTDEMAIAGGEAAQRSIGSWGEPELCYRAMLAASPYAQKDTTHESD